MSAVATAIGAIALSLAGVHLLAQQNAKRHRAADVTPRADTRRLRLGYSLLLAPLLLLSMQGQTAPFVLWLGALSVAGWFIALRRPSKSSGNHPAKPQNR